MPTQSGSIIARDARVELIMQSLDILRPCPPMDCTATVLSSEWLTPTIKAIQLVLDQPAFRFLPGQAVWAKFQREQKELIKIYSIASSPSHCPQIELCVSRVGWGSAYLQDIPVGGAIAFRAPYGLLTLDRLPKRPRVYIAEGSGIAPLKSQIEWLRESDFEQPLWLIQANPETGGVLPYQEDWRSLQKTWHNFTYLEASNCHPESLLMRQRVDWRSVDVEICAVGDRVDQLQEMVLALGASIEAVRGEKFFAV